VRRCGDLAAVDASRARESQHDRTLLSISWVDPAEWLFWTSLRRLPWRSAWCAWFFCSSCGQGNPGDARFCSGCGAALAATPAQREVRKTVTVPGLPVRPDRSLRGLPIAPTSSRSRSALRQGTLANAGAGDPSASWRIDWSAVVVVRPQGPRTSPDGARPV
jgi:hypothetical protein